MSEFEVQAKQKLIERVEAAVNVYVETSCQMLGKSRQEAEKDAYRILMDCPSLTWAMTKRN